MRTFLVNVSLAILVLIAVMCNGCAYRSDKCHPNARMVWPYGLCVWPGEKATITIPPNEMQRGNPALPVYVAPRPY